MSLCRILAVAVVAVVASLAASTTFASGYNFRCFFDSGSDAIGSRCEAELHRFVDVWQRYRAGQILRHPPDGTTGPPVAYRVIIQGHVDLAEDRRNLSVVSERRARAVAEWIVAAGIPRDLVSAEGHSATRLLVPTNPGEAEPQNRRVEIILR